MTTIADRDGLIQNLDRVVRDTLAYFDGPGRVTRAHVDRWGARDILMHFIYFHEATAWGIQSAAAGGPPWPVPADSDLVNEVCRRLHEHESFDELLAQVRQAHARLVCAAPNAPDLDKPCFRRATGGLVTGPQRVGLLARHLGEAVGGRREAGSAEAKGEPPPE